MFSCSVKDESLIGFAVIPGSADSSINSLIIGKNIHRGNFIYACSEKASLSELTVSLSDAGCSKIIIRGDAFNISENPAIPQNAVIIDPPAGMPGFKFNTEYALKRADQFRLKRFRGGKFAIILPDNNEFRVLAGKCFPECRDAVFLNFDYGRYDSYDLEKALSHMRDIAIIIHYSGYSSERIKSFCSENGIYSASVFSDLKIDSVNIFSAEKDYSFAGEYAFMNSHGNEIAVMPADSVKITEFTGQ